MPNVLSQRDLVSRPDIMDETVPHKPDCTCYLHQIMDKETREKTEALFILCDSAADLHLHLLLFLFAKDRFLQGFYKRGSYVSAFNCCTSHCSLINHVNDNKNKGTAQLIHTYISLI